MGSASCVQATQKNRGAAIERRRYRTCRSLGGAVVSTWASDPSPHPVERWPRSRPWRLPLSKHAPLACPVSPPATSSSPPSSSSTRCVAIWQRAAELAQSPRQRAAAASCHTSSSSRYQFLAKKILAETLADNPTDFSRHGANIGNLVFSFAITCTSHLF